MSNVINVFTLPEITTNDQEPKKMEFSILGCHKPIREEDQALKLNLILMKEGENENGFINLSYNSKDHGVQEQMALINKVPRNEVELMDTISAVFEHYVETTGNQQFERMSKFKSSESWKGFNEDILLHFIDRLEPVLGREPMIIRLKAFINLFKYGFTE